MVHTLVLIGIAVVAFFILNPFVIVGPGERAVLLNFGAVQDKVLGEGFHLRMPIMQRVVPVDVRNQKDTERDGHIVQGPAGYSQPGGTEPPHSESGPLATLRSPLIPARRQSR